MKTHWWVFAALLILGLVIVGCTTDEQPTEAEDAEQAHLTALRTSFMQTCMQEHQDESCEAFVHRDADLCDKINTPEDKTACKQEIVAARAYKVKDTSNCLKAPDTQTCTGIVSGNAGMCDYKDIVCQALATRNKNHCDKAQEPDTCKQHYDFADAIAHDKINLCHGDVYCEAFITRDPSLCDSAVQSYCEQRVAIQLGHATGTFQCDNVDDSLQEFCKNEKEFYLLNKGANEKDPAFCAQIIDEQTRMSCMSVAEDNLEACKQVASQPDKLYCLKGLMEHEADSSLCTTLQDEALQQDCIAFYNEHYGSDSTA